jgi:NAD(P)-dependent dehydrogenase (short-subunit alcohol dehydrogenase family)
LLIIIENGVDILKTIGDGTYFEFADVSDSERAKLVVESAVAKLGYINVIVNCAGIGSGTRILPSNGGVFPLDKFKRVIDVNLTGTFNYICQGALHIAYAPENEDGERGVIINCSSISAKCGQIGQAAYAASKGGIEAMTLPIARELSRIGIRINTIAPGVVSTNITSVDFENMPKVRQIEERENMNDLIAKDYVFPKRRGKAEEFASLALEIIRNSLMNGSIYPLDGAIRLSPK